jgi:hypothetical protein
MVVVARHCYRLSPKSFPLQKYLSTITKMNSNNNAEAEKDVGTTLDEIKVVKHENEKLKIKH